MAWQWLFGCLLASQAIDLGLVQKPTRSSCGASASARIELFCELGGQANIERASQCNPVVFFAQSVRAGPHVATNLVASDRRAIAKSSPDD